MSVYVDIIMKQWRYEYYIDMNSMYDIKSYILTGSM